MTEPYPLFDPDYPNIRLLWDSTCIGDLQRDPYYYMMQRVKGYGAVAAPLEFGKIYHSALEVRDRALIDGHIFEVARELAKDHAVIESEKVNWAAFNDNYRTPFSLRAAVLGYCQKWNPEECRPYVFPNGKAAIEQDFCLPILLPSGEPLRSPSGRPYLLCGYFDGIRYWNGRVVGWERKHTTTTLDSYFHGFEDDNQVLTYGYALQCLFPELGIRSVVVDACQLLQTKSNAYERREFMFSKAQMEGHIRDVIMWIKFAEMCAVGTEGMINGLIDRVMSRDPTGDSLSPEQVSAYNLAIRDLREEAVNEVRPWWPRKRNKWSPTKDWQSVLSEPPAMREAYARSKFGEPGEVWNPTKVRNIN